MPRTTLKRNLAPPTHALSIRQPFAELVAHGLKAVEVRSWPVDPEKHPTIAIHASSRLDRATVLWLRDVRDPVILRAFSQLGLTKVWKDPATPRAKARRIVDIAAMAATLERGALVGVVEVKSCWKAGEYAGAARKADSALAGAIFADDYLWFLQRAVPIPAFGIDGKLNLWPLPPAAARHVALALKVRVK